MTLFSGDYPIPMPSDQCDHPVTWRVRMTYVNGSIRIGTECKTCSRTLDGPEFPRLGLKRAAEEWGLCGADVEALPVRFCERSPELYRQFRSQFYWQKRREWWSWYNGYLASPYWLAKRQAVLERDDYTCCGCKGEANQVHHLTYERVGREALEDLVSICAACHAYHHEEMDRRLGRNGSHREAAE